MMDHRKEKKYLLGVPEMNALESRIRAALPADKNQKGSGYLIRSLYFDSPDDICVRENEAGVGEREKYRIRTYDNSDLFIRAEIKKRYRDTIKKKSGVISKEIFKSIVMSGDLDPLYTAAEESIGEERDTLWEYILKLSEELYRPRIIVQYYRSAYVYSPGNVRITFDRNIGASNKTEKFFDPDLVCFPVLEPGMNVLEIKYDELLPPEIEELVEGFFLRSCSVSKYCLARKVQDGLGICI